MLDTHIKTGDLVIGNTDPTKAVFSTNGKKLTDGVFSVGSADSLNEITNTMLKNAERAGAKITPAKKNKLKKQIKNKSTTSEIKLAPAQTFEDMSRAVELGKAHYEALNAYVAKSTKSEAVTFENSFGRMRVSVESILEHEFAFMLVFSDAQQLIFEPKIGESLTLIMSTGSANEVYYPGVIFDWPDGVKKAMLLFKKAEE